MIALGYMLKRVAPPPEWMNAPNVLAVHSMSHCVSDDIGDYINLWRHNGWWLFDSPETVKAAAAELGTDTSGMTLFYFEAYENEFDHDQRSWRPFKREDGFETDVTEPASKVLNGFDVVTYSVATTPECSPLSCNDLASQVAVNARCLFDTFDEAKSALEAGLFGSGEPGPYRIIAVYELANPN